MTKDEIKNRISMALRRSISGDYCFDGMNTEEAHREIKKHFDDFQTKIARGLEE